VPIELCIVTPEGQTFAGPVDQVVLPGAEGDFGVLEGHERFLAPLRIGAVEIQQSSASQWAAVSSGFAEVNGGQVTVLVDECEMADGIDAAAARADQESLKSSLADLSGSDEDEHRRSQIESALELLELKIELAGQ